MSLLCSACGFNNPPGMRFCGNCGTHLSEVETGPIEQVRTTNLGVMMGADLVERFRKAGIQATGQRRNVTVLFVDLTDYTRLSEKTDSEELYEIIQQFVNMLVSSVYKYDGMVDKIVGDGLMALFGAPIGHENNAELAVRSAMEMQVGIAELNHQFRLRLQQELQLHIGIHSGAVVVGGLGSNMLMDYTAIGDTVNLAHRLEEAADPDSILVSDSVYRQTRMIFNFMTVNSLSLKGIVRAVTGYRVVGQKDNPGLTRGLDGLNSPMIGRDSELAQLEQAIFGLTQKSQGGFAMIFGEAGIGKSRLVRELVAKIDKDMIGFFEAQSLTYRRSVAYWIFIDLVRNYLGVSLSTPETQIWKRLSEIVERVLGERSSEVIPYLAHLLSLKQVNKEQSNRIRQLDADQLRQQIFIAVRDLFLAESKKRSVFLIFDDLHWADDASLELLQFLLGSVQSAPIYICGISRPVNQGLLSELVQETQKQLKGNSLTIQLTKLPEAMSEQLLYELLTLSEMPERLRSQIIQKAAGIPFYLEEILRVLIDEAVIYKDGERWRLYPEADMALVGVPDNLQALILARFDRLDQQQRRILQVASVIGRDFSSDLIKIVLPGLSGKWIDDQLSILINRGFILSRPDSRRAGYSFRHVLTSDAIYSTLLRKDRGELHGKVGDAIEILYADRINEFIYLLARHFSWSTQHDRALYYLILAGKKSAGDFINSQAREYFEQAFQLLPQVDHEPLQAYEVNIGLGDAKVFIGEYHNAREHYRLARNSLDIMGVEDPQKDVAVSRKISKTYARQGDHDQALAYLSLAQQTLDSAAGEFPIEIAEVLNDIGWIFVRRSEFDEAEGTFRLALDLVVDSDAFAVIASIYNRLGGVAYFQGKWDQAAEYLRNSISICESIGDVAGLVSSANNLANLELDMGRYDDALEDMKRNLELVKNLGQVENIAVAYNNLGWLYMLRGETAEARESLDRALELACQIGFSSLVREVQKNIGELNLVLEHWEQTEQILNELLPSFEEHGTTDQLINIYRLLGEAAIGKGNLDQASYWEDKIDQITSRSTDNLVSLPNLAYGELLRFHGMLAIAKNDWEKARSDLEQSVAVFRKQQSRLNIGRSLLQLGFYWFTQQGWDKARSSLDEAAQIFAEIGAKLDARRVEKARKEMERIPQ